MNQLTEYDLNRYYKLFAKNNGYENVPPTIIEFISNPYYIGKSFDNGRNIFRFWKEVLIDLFPTPFFELDMLNSPNIIVLKTAIGSGKCHNGDSELLVVMDEDDIKKYGLEEYVFDDYEELKRIKIPAKVLFKKFNISYKSNGEKEQIFTPPTTMFAITPSGKLSKINYLVIKKTNTYEYTLENNQKLKVSDKHLVLENNQLKTIDKANSVDNIDGNSYKIISKKLIKKEDITYDISIGSPHLYIGPDGTIHHNTTIAVIQFLYILARLLYLKNPQKHFNLPSNSTIYMTLISPTLEMIEKNLLNPVMSIIRESPFFINNFSKDKIHLFKNKITISKSSTRRMLVSKNIFTAVFDEASRIINEAQREIPEEIINRLYSRFLDSKTKTIPGKAIFINSPDDNLSFIEEIINKIEGNGKTNLKSKIITGSIWEIKRENYKLSGETFKIFIGSQTSNAFIINKPEDLEKARHIEKIEKRKLIFDIPVEFRETFEFDLVSSIKNILGQATASENSFLYDKEKLKKIFTHDQPITDTVILSENTDVSKIVDVTRLIDKEMEHVVALDIALTTDRFGFALGHYKIDDKVNKIYIDLAFAFVPKKNSRIPLYKVREFIEYLHNSGVNIQWVVSDSFQSADMLQILAQKGFNTITHSVDKTKEPYYVFRDAILEERVFLPNNELLKKELNYLQEDGKKIDHPMRFGDGSRGSKDIADAVCQVNYILLDKVIPDRRMNEQFLDEVNRQFSGIVENPFEQFGIDINELIKQQKIGL